jgi:ABC-type multidrug transport system ATPase subunit
MSLFLPQRHQDTKFHEEEMLTLCYSLCSLSLRGYFSSPHGKLLLRNRHKSFIAPKNHDKRACFHDVSKICSSFPLIIIILPFIMINLFCSCPALLLKYHLLKCYIMELSINNLNKTYPNGVIALNNIKLEIGKGVFGLLGPNGAGKSSLMRTIATLQQADAGTIHFGGKNIWQNQQAFRKKLGYLPQEFGVYPRTSAWRLLDYFAQLKGIASRKERHLMIEKVLELTNLYDARKKSVANYSGGMKRRFGIAQILLNQPQLIIVDEPTAGLDPAERTRFLNLIRALGSENTVIFSTHIVEDVQGLCHELCIMNQGKMLMKATPQSAINHLKDKLWTKAVNSIELESIRQKYRLLSANYISEDQLSIRILSQQQPDNSFDSAAPQLEDAYFNVLLEDQA